MLSGTFEKKKKHAVANSLLPVSVILESPFSAWGGVPWSAIGTNFTNDRSACFAILSLTLFVFSYRTFGGVFNVEKVPKPTYCGP